MNDTICAISTSLGVGAISIIRVSGEDAIKKVAGLFSGKDLTKVESHTIHYGHIINNNEVIDEVLVSVFKAPKTYTKEDIVEINSHGGIAPTKKVLEILLENGIRLAEKGEFTKRAFLNGRLDLCEAESVNALLSSNTDLERKLALNGISGKVSRKIKKVREIIVELMANIEVNIDFPEYEDALEITLENLPPRLKEIKKELENLLDEAKVGKLISEGIKVAIVGRPNVGKSSILNHLLQENKAIVTDIAGTTRDIVEGQIKINGVILNIIDTAGIRETDDKIEALGVEKSLKIMEEADLILFMLNNNEELTKDIEMLLDKLNNKKYIIIINKNDLETKLDKKLLKKYEKQIVNLSVLKHQGIDNLKEKIIELFNINELETKDPTYLSNSRSISILKRCLKSIEEVEKGLEEKRPIDMLELDIKNIWEELGLINGTSYEEELLDEMFSRFCLGK